MQLAILGSQAQLHMDAGPRHVVVVAPAETSATTRFDLAQTNTAIHSSLRVCSNTVESQFQVYRAISVHAQEVCRSVGSNPGCRLNYSVLRCWSRCAPEACDRQTVSLPHAKTFLARPRAGTMRSNVCARSVLSELRSFFSLYDNLFTVPCCACGDLL